ncbi:MAG TPA: hypothetical protein VK788_06805 [Terriglobales bacterium]|jgi:hypothetical protein|nr:hypothetical protein [Terriglobales bacterium]
MTKQEIEALGQAMVKEHGLSDWTVRAVYEQDDMGDEDDIAGSYGRALHEERLIWVNMRYGDDPTLVREILLHETAHALLGQREGVSTGRNSGSSCARSAAVCSTPLVLGRNVRTTPSRSSLPVLMRTATR